MRLKNVSLGIILLCVLCASAAASITEIRQNFFQQTADLPASAIMSGPTTGDGSYLIVIYESGNATAIPTLRWTDENGVAQASSPAACSTICQWLGVIRVNAGTQPTVETNGYTGTSTFSLYVSGLGFWPDGKQGEHGLSEVSGVAVTDKLIHTAAVSISGLLVAYNSAAEGQQYLTWWDGVGKQTVTLAYGTPTIVPIRLAKGTSLRAYDITANDTHIYYWLMLFGLPAAGTGPYKDYEYNLLDWTDASYPNFETVFTNGATAATILLATNFAEQPNSGSVDEALGVTGVGGFDPSPCPNGILATPAGSPVGCIMLFTIAANTALQVRTANQTGSPWGPSPTYSAEIDVLQF